jgi:hypothetical protein
LIVYPDREIACERALERLELIARRGGEITDHGRAIDLHEIAACCSGEVRRKTLGIRRCAKIASANLPLKLRIT